MRIIFFDLDCLRPDHLGCYGYPRPTSPTIDGIAREGVRFNHYYASSSPCLPSRACLFSGRFGIRNGIISNVGEGARFHIRKRPYGGPEPDNTMLMRQLRSNGLDTVSFSNFADRHNAWWFGCGWSEYHTPNLKGGNETADEINRPLMKWLKHNAQRDDYLLHINYWDIHRIYKMDPSWADRFDGHPIQAWPDEETIQRHQSLDGPFTAQRQFQNGVSRVPLMPGSVSSREDFEHMINGYDAAIAYTDDHVRMVLEELDRQEVLDDAVVIVSGDHGDAFGEHGVYSDHVCADECIHHIPLIIRWPGVTPENESCDSLLYNVDMSATLCDLLGCEIPADWDGTSFAKNVRNGSDEVGHPYLVWDHGLYAVQRAVRTRTHLMVRTYHPFKYDFKPLELYDLSKDPYQTTDISESSVEIVQECDSHMSEWIQVQKSKGNLIRDPLDTILSDTERYPPVKRTG